MMSQERPSPSSSDDDTANTNLSDEHLSPPPSPSTSGNSTSSESNASTSSLASAGSSAGSEPVVSKKTPRPPVRSWPASEEIALLEAVVAYRQKHGRLPPPTDLAAALRGRVRGEDRLGAQQAANRLRALRSRYDSAAIRLSRGTIPVKDDDVTIYRLSKEIWAGTRKGKREKKTRAADAREEPRELAELAELYPCLSAEVEGIDVGTGAAAAGVLKRAFRRIGDDTAARLEVQAKRQRVAEAKASAGLDQLRRNVARELMKLIP